MYISRQHFVIREEEKINIGYEEQVVYLKNI
jgi:hypothetical protein